MASDEVTFVILTISDSCSAGKAEDTSGDSIIAWLKSYSGFHSSVVDRRCVPDDKKKIKSSLIYFCDTVQPNVLLTTGGTGFSSRDVTPEATKSVLDKEAPGIVIAMLQGSLKVTPMAMLSRPACGIRGNTLIINFPGSKKGAVECLEIVAPALRHAIDLLRDCKANIETVHLKVQDETHKRSHLPAPHKCHHDDADEGGEKIAFRLRNSSYEALSVANALAEVLSQSHLGEAETVPYYDCGGRILAEDVLAQDPLPPFPAAIKDGYAVVAVDGAGIRKVLGGSFAGSKPDEVVVHPGFCVRINTGAPVPPGADAVVQVESTKLVTATDDGNTELEVEIMETSLPGKEIRQIGSDIGKGQLVLTRDSKLGFSELGVLAAVGATEVKVYKLPSVGILSTGNELVEPGESLQSGKIRDCNKTVLQNLLKERGFSSVDLGIVKDSTEALKSKLKYAFDLVDVLVTTGGVSMGDKDLLKPVLKENFSADIKFGRVRMKPGLPTTFATVLFDRKLKLIFALPGNPVSAAVTCNLFVVPALRKMAGWQNPASTVVRAKVPKKINLDPRPEFQRAILKWTGDTDVPSAFVTGNQISSRLLSVTSANVLLVLPPRTEEKPCVEEGEIVDCIVIGDI